MDSATRKPLDRETIAALRIVARELRADCAYWSEGRFWFPLSDEWALAISPDSAGRFRLAACYGRSEAVILWSLGLAPRRLADLARSLRTEIEALSAQRG